MSDRIGETALVDFDTADDAEDVVSFGDGVGKTLENEHAAAFGAGVTVCGSVEGFALASWGEEVGTVKTQEHLYDDGWRSMSRARI